jgi:hypothetical protein
MLFVEMTNHLQFAPSSLLEVMLSTDKITEAMIKVWYSQRQRKMCHLKWTVHGLLSIICLAV